MVQRLGVNQFYTAPTALRLLLKAGDEYVKRYDRSSLRILACGKCKAGYTVVYHWKKYLHHDDTLQNVAKSLRWGSPTHTEGPISKFTCRFQYPIYVTVHAKTIHKSAEMKIELRSDSESTISHANLEPIVLTVTELWLRVHTHLTGAQSAIMQFLMFPYSQFAYYSSTVVAKHVYSCSEIKLSVVAAAALLARSFVSV